MRILRAILRACGLLIVPAYSQPVCLFCADDFRPGHDCLAHPSCFCFNGNCGSTTADGRAFLNRMRESGKVSPMAAYASVASIPGSLQQPPAQQPETPAPACDQTKKDLP